MKKIYTGKTKDVYELTDGNYKLVFKDDMTGEDGVFDPGANTVGLTVDGAGVAGLGMSVYYFKLLEEKGFNTQYISSEENSMTVKPCTVFGKGLEVICRFVATGSFVRRYGDYIEDGKPLDAIVEMTIKNDERGDPLITEDSLIALGIFQPGMYGELKKLTKNMCTVIRSDLADKGVSLLDIKLEFGIDRLGKLTLIDEISGGNMRVTQNGKALHPLELAEIVSIASR
ncbi:MAG: phosphoribosylaminoimidazolesuccinocarboxamide synthase [Oscillospiraceae bacterium]|nr:phosphoribosylaminoimidazolesuccinocarboxamide synthase [Oscillospiraceae bacterium]